MARRRGGKETIAILPSSPLALLSDVILVKQAKLWAQQEIAKEPPSADPLKDLLDKDEYTNDEASYGEICPVSAKTTFGT